MHVDLISPQSLHLAEDVKQVMKGPGVRLAVQIAEILGCYCKGSKRKMEQP